MRPRRDARVLLGIGFLAVSLAYVSWISLRTAFDPDATYATARRLLATAAVREELGSELAGKVARELHESEVDALVVDAVEQALDDPRVVDAFAAAARDVHAALVENGGATVTLDPRAVTGAISDALAERDPEMAAEITRHPVAPEPFEVPELDRLREAREMAWAVFVLGGIGGVALIAASLSRARDRRHVAALGRRVAYLSVPPLVGFVVVPRLLRDASGDFPELAGALLDGYAGRVVPSAIALLIAGVLTIAGARFLAPPSEDEAAAPPGPAILPAPAGHSPAPFGSVPPAPAAGAPPAPRVGANPRR
jgi:hypothetical protein